MAKRLDRSDPDKPALDPAYVRTGHTLGRKIETLDVPRYVILTEDGKERGTLQFSKHIGWNEHWSW